MYLCNNPNELIPFEVIQARMSSAKLLFLHLFVHSVISQGLLRQHRGSASAILSCLDVIFST